MNGLIHKSRVALIEIGKIMPFVICAIVVLSYCECLYSLITKDYVLYDDSTVLNKEISWFIGNYFEYNITTIVILLTISLAVETCYWNKLTILYLAFQLFEKNYFITIELYEEHIYIIVIANIIVSGFLVYKGMTIQNMKLFPKKI